MPITAAGVALQIAQRLDMFLEEPKRVSPLVEGDTAGGELLVGLGHDTFPELPVFPPCSD